MARRGGLLSRAAPEPMTEAEMIRFRPIGAVVFALAPLALPTFALPPRRPRPADASRHARAAAGRQPRRGRRRRPGPGRRSRRRPADDVVRRRADRRRHRQRRRRPREGAVQDRLRVRRRPPRPLRRLEGRAAGQRRDRAALPLAQDGGTKALRIDMGTSCGPQYVDIQVVPLPGPRSTYAGNFGAISDAVRARSAPGRPAQRGGPRRRPVDGGRRSSASARPSWARPARSRARPTSTTSGGLTSILFTRDGAPLRAPRAGAGGPRASCTR